MRPILRILDFNFSKIRWCQSTHHLVIINFLVNLLYFHMHVSQHRIQFLVWIFIVFTIFLNAILILTIHFIDVFQILELIPSIPHPLDTSIHSIIRANQFSFDIEQ